MSEYTYADVIIDPNDKRVKIGERYYFADTPKEALELANNYEASNYEASNELANVFTDNASPFVSKTGDYGYACLVKSLLEGNEGALQDYSYTCMIKVKEPQVKYVPFDLSKKEVRDKLRGQWLEKKDKTAEFDVNIIAFDEGYQAWLANGLTSADLLAQFTFLDGTPCGEKISVEG